MPADGRWDLIRCLDSYS